MGEPIDQAVAGHLRRHPIHQEFLQRREEDTHRGDGRQRLQIVVGGYEVAAYVVFYSGDHPKMYADFDPALSPWIDYPNELKRKGFVGACASYAPDCMAKLDALDPAAEKLSVAVTRQIGDVKGETMIYDVRVSPPAK